MSEPCAACRDYRRRPGKTICNGCIERTRRILADQEEHRQELLIKLARDTRMAEPGGGGRGSDPGLAWSLLGPKFLEDLTAADTARKPYDVKAADMLREQYALLVFWCRLLRDELGVDLVPHVAGPTCRPRCHEHQSCIRIGQSQNVYQVAGMAILIEAWLDTLAGQDAAADLVVSLRTLEHRIMTAIDYPENRTRIHVGPCPVVFDDKERSRCPGEVEALFPRDETKRPVMRCRYCRAEWPAETWNRVGQLIMNRSRVA